MNIIVFGQAFLAFSPELEVVVVMAAGSDLDFDSGFAFGAEGAFEVAAVEVVEVDVVAVAAAAVVVAVAEVDFANPAPYFVIAVLVEVVLATGVLELHDHENSHCHFGHDSTFHNSMNLFQLMKSKSQRICFPYQEGQEVE